MGKTTTKEGKNNYMKLYMRGYRADERELLNKAKVQFGWVPPIQKMKRRKTK
jgi:hypothetical protein